MGVLSNIKKENLYFFFAFITLAVIGYFHFSQFADYTYMSDRHYLDIIRSKAWVLIWIIFSFVFLYLKRESKYVHLYAIFAVSVYFIILYGILYRGTEYGLNSHWGDNSYRLPMVQKMMHTGKFVDPFLKDLSCMYPPLWFYLTGIFAKVFNLEAFQTIKFSYYLVFLFYPWLIYFSWRKIVNKKIAAALAVCIPLFSHTYLNYIYYEHISATLFIPWWLYYFEDVNNNKLNKRKLYYFYLIGILIGSLIYLTYYWWFFICIIAYPISIIYKKYHLNYNSKELYHDFIHKLKFGLGITILTSIYWGPLIYSAMTIGFSNNQADWFNLNYTNITRYFTVTNWDSIVIVLGVFSLGYIANRWKQSSLVIYFFGAILLMFLDRLFNLGFNSIQTRKLLEFLPLLCITPLIIATCTIWEKLHINNSIRNGLVALFLFMCLITSNEQTEIYKDNKLYKMSLDQIYPSHKLDVINTVEAENKVFLTNHYIESCYIPYYLFTHVSNVPMHFASKFKERIRFLEDLQFIDNNEIFVYLLRHNIFDQIDYIYLPFNTIENGYEFKINIRPFKGDIEYKTVYIPKALVDNNSLIEKKHRLGLFEVKDIAPSKDIENKIKDNYDEYYKYLKINS